MTSDKGYADNMIVVIDNNIINNNSNKVSLHTQTHIYIYIYNEFKKKY